VQTYQPEDPDLEQCRLDMGWVSRIAAALGEDRLRLHYQPIVPADPAGDERHMEALLYLVDEGGQRIGPSAFIPAAERYILIPTVDRWVVNHAFSLLKL
jgi:EAL domain-containing protein (putative c-di-GMP-specific phosphodiesterase class I)